MAKGRRTAKQRAASIRNLEIARKKRKRSPGSKMHPKQLGHGSYAEHDKMRAKHFGLKAKMDAMKAAGIKGKAMKAMKRKVKATKQGLNKMLWGNKKGPRSYGRM